MATISQAHVPVFLFPYLSGGAGGGWTASSGGLDDSFPPWDQEQEFHKEGWWWRGAVGDWRPLEAKQQVRPPPGVKQDEIQPTLSAGYISSWGRKRANEREKTFFFLIHLLYTILRHKFKQQRIGKSLADQQDQYLLWGTHHLPEFPCSVHRPIRPLQLWAPRPPGQTSHMKMPECYIRVCWTERSTRSRREARWHPGQWGSG